MEVGNGRGEEEGRWGCEGGEGGWEWLGCGGCSRNHRHC